jgi:hypothetical protein
MKLTIERIKKLIKEELNRLNENKEDEGVENLTDDQKEKIRNGLFQNYLNQMKPDERKKNNEKAEEMAIRTEEGNNAVKFKYEGKTYYGQI